jgi:hypothetical protein
MPNALLTANDSCDRNDVVGIGRVPHPKNKSQSNNGEEFNHGRK